MASHAPQDGGAPPSPHPSAAAADEQRLASAFSPAPTPGSVGGDWVLGRSQQSPADSSAQGASGGASASGSAVDAAAAGTGSAAGTALSEEERARLRRVELAVIRFRDGLEDKACALEKPSALEKPRCSRGLLRYAAPLSAVAEASGLHRLPRADRRCAVRAQGLPREEIDSRAAQHRAQLLADEERKARGGSDRGSDRGKDGSRCS